MDDREAEERWIDGMIREAKRRAEESKHLNNEVREELTRRVKARDVTLLSEEAVLTPMNSSASTPLHELASAMVMEVLEHPASGMLINLWQLTPIHLLASALTREYIVARREESENPQRLAEVKGKIQKLLQNEFIGAMPNLSNTPLCRLASSGCVEILASPHVANEDFFSATPLHRLAESILEADVQHILAHPKVSSVANGCWRETPLHILASRGHIEVLEHPDVGVVQDMFGWTPLHNLAFSLAGARENRPQRKNNEELFLKHSLVGVVRNDSGKTPLELLASEGNIAGNIAAQKRVAGLQRKLEHHQEANP